MAQRIDDPDVMRGRRVLLKTRGKKGIAQGDVLAALRSNVYLTQVDRLCERAQEGTREGKYTHVESVRFADELVIFIDGHRRHDGLLQGGRATTPRRVGATACDASMQTKAALSIWPKGRALGCLALRSAACGAARPTGGRTTCPRCTSGPPYCGGATLFSVALAPTLDRVIQQIQPILRGWVHSFAIGHASRCFCMCVTGGQRRFGVICCVPDNAEGFGWKRWSRQGLYRHFGLFGTYRVSRPQQLRLKALPEGEVAYPLRRSRRCA